MATLKDQIKKNRHNNFIKKEKNEEFKFNDCILNDADQIAKFIDNKVDLKEKFMDDVVEKLSNKYKVTLNANDYVMKAKYELADKKDKSSNYHNAAEKLGFDNFDGLYLDYIIDVVNKFDDGKHAIDKNYILDYLGANVLDDALDDYDVDIDAVKDEMGCLQLKFSVTFYYKDYYVEYTECQYEQPDYINHVSKIKINLSDMQNELEKQGIDSSYRRIEKDDGTFDTYIEVQLDDDY